MARGRFPTLHTNGGYLLSVGLVLLVLGVAVGQWSISALGMASLSLLCAGYVGFALRVSLLWRRHLELLLWHASPARLKRLIHVEGDARFAEKSDRAVMWLVPHFLAVDVAGMSAAVSRTRSSRVGSSRATTRLA